MTDTQEDILTTTADRYVLFPIKYPAIWDMYKKAKSTYWTPEEVDLSKDNDDWDKLSDNERYFIKNVLAFFAAQDLIVSENLDTRFTKDVKVPEALAFYAFQDAVEYIHSESYALMLDTYVKDPKEKSELFHAMHNLPWVKKKAEWAIKWVNDMNSPFALRLLAFSIVEGVLFSGSFCSIYWLKERGLMPGLTTFNEFISRDETLHTEFAVLLYTMLKNKLPAETVYSIMQEAIEMEKEFICQSLPCELLGMNAKLMSEYIEFVADRLLVQLGYEKRYFARNPFPFMNRISLDLKENFFESRVQSYAKANVGKNNVFEFKLDEEF
jgi:ribonucleotide reductase beta subunit family protein with ferritin-like domain